MCTATGDNPVAVNKYIISYKINKKEQESAERGKKTCHR
jgi:hypothetical protein